MRYKGEYSPSQLLDPVGLQTSGSGDRSELRKPYIGNEYVASSRKRERVVGCTSNRLSSIRW
jgi:hypothetical protein